MFRRVGARPNKEIFCVKGMDIFLSNIKGKSTASILCQKLREHTIMAFKNKQKQFTIRC